MGVLGRDFAWGSAVKVVIIELLDEEDKFEVAHVYGENEDFDVVRTFPLGMVAQFCKENLNNYLRNYLCSYSDVPVYTCKISHKNEKMSKEEAINMILNASEPWEIK